MTVLMLSHIACIILGIASGLIAAKALIIHGEARGLEIARDTMKMVLEQIKEERNTPCP